ncbi:MAG TPA: alpha-(1-_3)-arabinofuranosyltransferase family protein, partial [Acidimicrobiales bacterium]
LALAGLALVRFRHKAFFLVVTVVGLLVAVGAHPFDAPSVLGGLFKAFTGTESGLAMRSTPRALPLLELGLAAGFGAGVGALAAAARRVVAARQPPAGAGGARSMPAGWGRWATPLVVALSCLLVMANLSPMFIGQATADNLTRDEQFPDYWLDAAAAIDAGSHDTRVLEIPGSDFAAYRWGDIVDPLTPGLVDRPYLARELIPNGEPASASLLLALDRRYQEGVAEEDALVPIAQLFGVGDIVLRNDLEYERFNTPRPYIMWNSLTSTPGLSTPEGFGEPGRNDARPPKPLLDEKALAEPSDQPASPPVALFRLDDPLPIVRTVPYATPMLVAGDGEGLVDLAALGLLDPRQAILFSGTFADDADGLQQQIDAGATLVVTDTNAKRGLRWGSVRENEGYVERADEDALRYDPSENRLEVFPDETTDSQTVAVQRGGTVDATAYGNPVSFTPETRPYRAFDGDPTTWWSVGGLDDAVGERIVLTLDEPTELDHLTLLQAPGNRHIAEARVRVGDERFDVDLGPESLGGEGQTVTFPPTTADRVEIEVLTTDPGGLASYDNYSGVGFAEIGVPGVQVRESLRLPTDLLTAVGTDDLDHPLYIVVTRNRTDPTNPGRPDPEGSLHRELTLPSSRSFTLVGDVRLDSSADAAVLATFLGGGDGARATASSWLPGDIGNRGRAAFDDDPTTWWTPAFGDPRGVWVQLDVPTGAAPSELTVTYPADGRHSGPSRLSVQADGTTVATVDVPDAVDGPFGTTQSVTIPIPAGTTAGSWRVTVDEVHPRITSPWLGGDDYALPVAIASVDGLGVTPAAMADAVDTGCRSDLVAVDGQPVPVRVTGSVADAAAGRALQLLGCGDLAVAAGDVTIDTAPGSTTGLDVDRLALASLPGGTAVPAAASGSVDDVVAALQPSLPAEQPSVTVTSERPDRVELEVTGLDEQSWLVFGQSLSDGWTATSPELGDLGGPTLIQGFANGWTLDPATGTVHLTLEWGPQKVVWAGVAASLLGVLACLAILLVPLVLRRRRRERAPGPPSDDDHPLALDRPDRPGGRTAALVAGIGIAVFAALNLPRDRILLSLALAVGLGVATGLVVRSGRGQTALAWVAPAALAVAGIYAVLKEWRGGYRSSEWPQIFDPVHVLGIVAVLALAAVAVVTAWRDERGTVETDEGVSRPRPAGGGDPAPPA